MTGTYDFVVELITIRSERVNVHFTGSDLMTTTRVDAEYMRYVRLFKLTKATKTNYFTETVLPHYIYPDESLHFLLEYFKYNQHNVDPFNRTHFLRNQLTPKKMAEMADHLESVCRLTRSNKVENNY